MGSLLDPVADKVLVLAVLIVLVDRGVFAGWMVAAIVAREFLISGLRLAALERRRFPAVLGGLPAAGAWRDEIAWWALLVALVITWVSGVDYARAAPRLLRSRAAA